MFRLEKTFRFEAAHHLPNHDGKCRRVHGHSWTGRVVIEDYELQTVGPKAGMVMDYADLGAILAPIVEQYLDHHDLNETTGLQNPTSEELARWLYGMLKPLMYQVRLVSVVIEETCTNRAEYIGI